MYIVDTTLRDGEQQAGIALNVEEKSKIATLLDYIGVRQIEAGTPAIGGIEVESIKNIVNLGLKSKIATWNRMNINDIQASVECGVDIIHISVPASDLHIQEKLKKNRTWVKEQMKKCIDYARKKGFEIHVGLEDASRADLGFLLELCIIAKQLGASRVRYADTVGVLTTKKAYEDIFYLNHQIDIPLAIHTHNDFGMAVANSLASVRAGVKYVDCTIGGVGERTGNCNLLHLLQAYDMQMKHDRKIKETLKRLGDVQDEIMNIFYNRKLSSSKTFSLA
ncbi:hypothetical protein [Desulfuribacillus alkaliarsenatis]|uniref:hypothetical protein n=1 Tax=Desulfuribacillus alkaliarsenatis TaxID=766136 RepID=UPI000B2FF4E3|nr:hypothetical protein [Desulfuribacillus alkaliarsenatis]